MDLKSCPPSEESMSCQASPSNLVFFTRAELYDIGQVRHLMVLPAMSM